jgi:hypothetical protein
LIGDAPEPPSPVGLAVPAIKRAAQEALMVRLIFLLGFACATVATSTVAVARTRHYAPPVMYRYNPANDPNAVFVAGSYAGSDPDPNIRAALAREFGRF